MKQTSKELAQSMGHRIDLINAYEELKATTSRYKADHIAELDIIYFLQNILWSTNFELIAKVIVDYGMESRLDQWKEAIKELVGGDTKKEQSYIVNDPHLITELDAYKHLYNCLVEGKAAGHTKVDIYRGETKSRTWGIDNYIHVIRYKIENFNKEQKH